MTAVEIDIRRKAYPARDGRAEHLVIEDLHIELARGEFVCLVGPSGCGKSTLLNIVAGLDPAFDGRITIPAGHDKPRIGCVFQNPRLLPWRTVRHNIDLAIDATGAEPARVDHLLEIMGLGAWQTQYPERLSVGMCRRVAIVRAFATNPDLLLMDEPFVSLDPPTARRGRRLLQKLWRERPHTVLFVTHDVREAIALADRLVFLQAGPMRVLAETRVDLPDAVRHDAGAVEGFRQRLIDEVEGLAVML